MILNCLRFLLIIILFSSCDFLKKNNSQAQVTLLDWKILSQNDLSNTDIEHTPPVFNQKEVKISGFMLPYEDDLSSVNKFLFVPYNISCIHVPLPPENQKIHVEMASGRSVKIIPGAVWLNGKIKIEKQNDNNYIYKIMGTSVEPYQRINP